MVTHTPIPYFMSLPIAALYEWSHIVAGIQSEDAPKGGD